MFPQQMLQPPLAPSHLLGVGQAFSLSLALLPAWRAHAPEPKHRAARRRRNFAH